MEKTGKRGDIMRAALELIAEHGFHGAPMAMIAEKAGVGAGTIYRYFASKDVLMVELFRDLADEISARLENDAKGGSVRETFLNLHQTLICYFTEHPLHFRFFEQYMNSPYGVSHRRDRLQGSYRERDVYRDFFARGAAQKTVKDYPPFLLAALAFGPILYLVRDCSLGLITLDKTLIKQVSEACWDAIREDTA